ncbi:MAG: hypothetical protein WKF94_09005 [Solirubrobacteraceae bacterium]
MAEHGCVIENDAENPDDAGPGPFGGKDGNPVGVVRKAVLPSQKLRVVTQDVTALPVLGDEPLQLVEPSDRPPVHVDHITSPPATGMFTPVR